MKDLLKLLQEYREMHENHWPSQYKSAASFVFDEMFDIVNDYAATKLFQETIAKKGLRHFEVGGLDWFVQVDFHEGQEQTYDQPHIDDQWEIGLIYNSNMEQVDMTSDLWQFIADEIENFHL